MSHSPTKQALGYRRILLVVVAALMMKAAFPGSGGIPELAFIAMVPFLMAIKGLKEKNGLMLGLLYGFLIWFLCISWLPGTLIIKLQANPLLIWSIYFLSCAFFALPYGAFAFVCCSRGWHGTISGAIKSALCLTVLVSFFPYPLPGNLAHALYNRPIFIQLADLGGVPLVLLAILLINEFWALALLKLDTSRRGFAHALACGLMVLALMVGYGSLRLMEFDHTPTGQSVKLRIGAVQPNMPVDWQRQGITETELLLPLFQKTRELAQQNDLDLLVWPEIPVPFSYTESGLHRQQVDKLVQETGVPLMMMSGYIFEKNSQPGQVERYYNAAEYITDKGQEGVYYKRRLSPFGEQIPFEKTFPWLRKLFPNGHHYINGTEPQVFPVGPGVRAIPVICYESIFPDLTRDAVLSIGGNLLINQVNDGWFGDTPASEIHLALGLFRSVEFRLPMVRVANSGISALINASGVMQPGKKTQLFVESVIPGELSIVSTKTFFAVHGNLLLWGMVSLLILIELAAWIKTFEIVSGATIRRQNFS